MPFRREIKINTNFVSGTNTDFPVLIQGTYPYLKSTGNGGFVENINGHDIEFYNLSTGEKLNWELSRYEPTTGEIICWLKVPSVSSTGCTPIYIRYGDSSISAYQGNSTGVWSNSFISVYHFGTPSTLGLNDSTSNANTLVNLNSVTATSGKIYGGASLSAASSQALYGGAIIDNSLEFTVSAWVNVSSYSANGVNIAGMLNGIDSSFVDKQLRILNSSGWPSFYNYRAAARYATQVSALGTDTWVYLVGTTSNTANTGLLYKNGTNVASNLGSNVTGYNTYNLYIGGRGRSPYSYDYGDYFTGSVSEVRFSSTVRSADWIATEYNNQQNPSLFATISDFTIGGIISNVSTISNITSLTF